MPISPYLAQLREQIGHDLLLVPSVAVLIWDASGRLLLMRATETGRWQTIGGSVDLDEAPADAARREAHEEAGLVVHLQRLRAAVGGPGYRVDYPNGDACAYVSSVYDAVVASGTPTPDGAEADRLQWFDVDDVAALDLDPLNRLLLTDVGVIGG